MKKLSLILITLILPLALHAQLIKWDPGKPLIWANFSGAVDNSNPYFALTNCHINYSYTCQVKNQAFTCQFKIEQGFNPAGSWCKPGKQTDELLRHEQLHFDISQLFARKLLIAFDQKTYTANYQKEIKEVFEQVMKDVDAMQKQYDAETNHSMNKDKQKEWEAFIKAQLSQTPTY